MKTKKWKNKILLRASLMALSVFLMAMILAAAERKVTIAAVGDCNLSRRLSPHTEESYLKLMELIRKADVAYGNMEGTIHDKKGYPAPKGGDMNLLFPPFIADELKWAGFDMLGMANNHSMDYLIEGLFATQKNLKRAGIIYAGAGRNLEEASAPAYFDSKNGRIALINCASTFPSWFMASAARGDMIGRPGINPIRLNTTYQVTKSDLEALKKVGSGLRPPRSGQTSPPREIYNFLGLGRFKVGPKREVMVEVDKRDVKRIIDAVKDARQGAHIVMVSMHAHRQGPYLEKFARACIDAGADCFFSDGPHVLKGIEIYKGKPIFYSLGNFLFEYETVTAIPEEIYESWGEERGNKLDNLKSTPNDFYNIVRKMGNFQDEAYWTSVVARIVFSDGKLEEIKLYPITLNYGAERADPLGRPMLTDEKTGKKIIETMIDLSTPYGTKITYKEGIGVVQVK